MTDDFTNLFNQANSPDPSNNPDDPNNPLQKPRIEKVEGGYLMRDDLAQVVLKTIDQITTGMPQIVKAYEEQSKRLDLSIELVNRFRNEILPQLPAETQNAMDIFTTALLERLAPAASS